MTQQRQQYRDPADAYYPQGSAPVQSDMGNAYGYNTSRDNQHVEPADGSTVGGGSQRPQPYYGGGAQFTGSLPSPLATSGTVLSRAQESLSKYYGMGRDFLSDVNSPETRRRVAGLYSQNPEYSRQPGFSNWVSDSDERLDEYEGLMGDSISRSLIPPGPRTDEGLERLRAENQDEYNSRFDALAQPMRAAAHARQSVDAIRGPVEQREIERVRGESAGMTPEEIEQRNQEMYDENGNIRGTEPSIRGRLHDQDMAGARGTYEGRSENIPYDQSIMNRAAEGANRQETQDFAAGKPGFADRFRNLPPAEDENTIRMRRQDRTSPLDPRGEYFTRRRRPLKERQQKMAQAGWTEDGKRIEGSASAERKADRRKVRVNKQTGGEIEWGESGYEDGVDISRGLYNEIQNGEQSPEMIRTVIRQDSRVYLNRKRRGGMSSHLANRLDNKARALSRNMAGKPMYNKKGKLIGRRAPTVKSLDQFQNSMVRSTGGIDWLAGAGQAHGDINKVPEPAPILALAPPSMNLLNGQVNQNTKGYWAHNEDRMNNGNSPVDQHDRGVIGQLGISDATTFAEVIDSLESSNFDNFLTDVFNNDGREPAKKSMLSVVRRLQQLYASQGSNAGSKNQMKMLRELNEPGALNINEMSDWLSKFRKLDVGDSGDLLRDITPTPSGSAIPYSPS